MAPTDPIRLKVLRSSDRMFSNDYVFLVEVAGEAQQVELRIPRGNLQEMFHFAVTSGQIISLSVDEEP